MKKPEFRILTGRKGINDWLDLSFCICNNVSINLSLLGYGIYFNWVIKDSINDFVENYFSEDASHKKEKATDLNSLKCKKEYENVRKE